MSWLVLIGRRAGWRFLVAALAAAALVLSPWTARNVNVLGSPVWGRDNLGLELYTSNNDCAVAAFAGVGPNTMVRNGCHKVMHPNWNPVEAARVQEAGEVAYNRARLEDALAWVWAHPGRFAELTWERVVLFWFLDVGSDAVGLVTLAGFVGLALCWREGRRQAAWLLGSALAVYPLVYYVVQHFARYRYPVLWVSSLLAGYAAVAAWDRARGRSYRETGSSRHGVGPNS